MSGFLHSLAAQALGSRKNALHTVAHLPCAIPPSPVLNEEPDLQTAPSVTPGVERNPIAHRDAEWNHAPVQEPYHAKPHAEIDIPLRENEVIPSSPELLVVQSATEFIAKPDRKIAHPSSVKSRLQQAENRANQTVAGEFPVWDEVIKTQIQQNNSAAKSIANDEPYSIYSVSAAPPPLMPLQNPAQHSALNPGAAAQHAKPGGATWQSQVEETTEVHVSIGRIEVTAVHEAAPPKRAERPAPKPVSLDEYLSKRQGSKA